MSFSDEIERIIGEASVEFDRAWEIFKLDLETAIANYVLSLGFFDFFINSFGGINTVAFDKGVEFIDATGNAFGDFSLRLSQIPTRILSGELIANYFTTPKWQSQRVMTLAKANKMVAEQMVDSALDLIVARNVPGFVYRATKQGRFADDIVGLWNDPDPKRMRKIGKSLLKSKLARLALVLVGVVGAVVVVVMVYNWWLRCNEPQQQEKISSEALTNKNPFVVRRQRHRVRDNPKLTTR